jgi:hypothetical protein
MEKFLVSGYGQCSNSMIRNFGSHNVIVIVPFNEEGDKSEVIMHNIHHINTGQMFIHYCHLTFRIFLQIRDIIYHSIMRFSKLNCVLIEKK